MNVICFDLEGPLSPQDNAYDVMGIIENGHTIFEALSNYDDVLTLEGREGYEPGDTLKLIVPFLIHHGIKESDILRVSDTAPVVSGVKEVISKLRGDGWGVNIISTSYQQHATNIGAKVGVEQENIFCTSMPLDSYYDQLTDDDLALVTRVEERILAGGDIIAFLDDFYYKEIPKSKLGELMGSISVVGGQRKVDALKKVAALTGKPLNEIIVVGDSITDFKMLELVRAEGGLSVVFNGNEYAIPYGNVGISSEDMLPLLDIVANYISKGLDGVMEVCQGSEHVQWLMDLTETDREKTISLHKKYRKLVRGAAAKLG